MKKYNVTINGSLYEVEIEEAGSSSSPSPVIAKPAVAAPAAAQPAPTTPKPAVAAVPAAAGAEVVSAPMPGTVLNIAVAAGDSVKAGQTLLVLEAMKMENEIVAPRDAQISAVNTSKGAAVNTGDALITLA